jgi:hypothetical protein
LIERNQNAVLAIAVEVTDVDDMPNPAGGLSRHWKLIIVIVVLFVIGALVTTFTLVFARETSPPTDPPTMSRFSIMRGVIASSFEDDFPNSALQVRALDWLVTTDPANLAVDTDPSTLLQRYTAALFYFATVGEYWTNQSNWLTVPYC